jgi:hypothetical protein
MMRNLIASLIFAIPCTALASDDKKDAPKEAKTTAEILKAVEPLKGFGIVCTAEFHHAEQKTFVVSYNPYSGEAACHVHVYRFDQKTEKWVMFLNRIFQGTHDISVESRNDITIRNVKGEVIYKEKD